MRPRRLFDSITDASEYWIARRSLSSGGHSADPLAGDDGWGSWRARTLRQFHFSGDRLQTHVHDLAAPCARGVDESSAQRGRGECRMPVAPAASCALGSGRTHTSTTIRGEISPGCCYADPDNVDWSHWMPSHQPLLTSSSLRKTRKHRATFRIQTARQAMGKPFPSKTHIGH